MNFERGNYELHSTGNSMDIAWVNTNVTNKLNNWMREYFVQSWYDQNVAEKANIIDTERKILADKYCDLRENTRNECICNLQDMKFWILSDKFQAWWLVNYLYQDLKEELNIDLSNILQWYEDYISNELKISESSSISSTDYQRLINNVRTIVSMELQKIAKEIYQLKAERGWSLKNCQWIINDYFQKSLSKMSQSVLWSAKFYLSLQESPELRWQLSDKVSSLHVNMRERQIYQELIEKDLVIHNKEGFFDLPEESDFQREIDDIPTDILWNDSFFTANKTRNHYRDMSLMNHDYDLDGIKSKEEIKKLTNISILSEQDRETEQEFLLAMLAIEVLSSLPIAGTALSLGLATEDLFNEYDSGVENIKRLFPDMDQNYTVEKWFFAYAWAIATIIASMISLQGAIKATDMATMTRKLQRFDISSELIEKTFLKVWAKMWISYNNIMKLFNAEQTIKKDVEMLEKERKMTDHTRGLNVAFAA